MDDLQMPLTNVQLELWKLYATHLSDQDLEELREVLVYFYAKKSIQLADQVWEDKGLTNENMDALLNEE